MDFLKNIEANWKSGLTVALVSIPLSISLAVASGATPIIGIITAIWAGLFASIFGGSKYNIVGPTGALSGLISAYVILHGIDTLAMLAITVGLFILIAYFLKLERYLIFVPSSVIHGFTLGIALIIAFSQVNYALGLYGLEKHDVFFDNVLESFRNIGHYSGFTFIVFLALLSSLFILKKLLPKIPSPLIVSIIGIGIGVYFTNQSTFELATLGSVFGDLPFTLIQLPEFSFSKSLIPSAGAIAVVAILETMLSAKVADTMTRTKHDERKEMMGLGLANIASGLAGGMPGTAALARTSLNIKMGAKNNLSASISSLSLGIICYLLFSYFQYIPMAAIAAILTYVAVQMIELKHFIRFYNHQTTGFWLSLLVAAVTFYEDPIIGIMFGTGASLLIVVEKLSRGQFEMRLNSTSEGLLKKFSGDNFDGLEDIFEKADTLLYSIKGKLVYINSTAHISRFEEGFEKYKTIILRLRSVYYIDIDGAEALDEIIEIVQKRNQIICLTSINENIKDLLEKTSTGYRELKDKKLIFSKSEDALEYFGVTPSKEVL